MISYGGFIVSISILTAALSLLQGYQNTLKEGLLGTNGHIFFYNAYSRNLGDDDIRIITDYLDNQPEVEAYSPVLLTQAMSYKGKNSNTKNESVYEQIKGVIVRSIDWNNDNLPINYSNLVIEGTSELLNENDVVIGDQLANYLNISLHDELKLINPASMRFTIFGLKTGEKSTKVVGKYRSGVYETDSKTIFMNRETVNKLHNYHKNEDEYTLVEVSVKGNYIDNVKSISDRWLRELGYYYVINNWIDYNGNLFQMLVVQRWVIFIILSFIILIASFGIVSNTAKTIIEQKKEIGILSTIGADKNMIKAYLMGEMTLLGFISIVLGIAGGILFSWVLTKQTVLMLKGDVYFIESFTITLDLLTILIIIVVSLSIAVLASVVSLQRVSKLTVIETILGK